LSRTIIRLGLKSL